MASAINCFKIHKNLFTAEERKALRSESRKLAIEKKISPKDAMVQVVTAHRDELQAEYDKIADVVRKHYKMPEKKTTSQVELVKRYVKETGKKVEKGELGKVKEKYPKEWAEVEKADAHKKELWDKLPEDFRKNRGINEYTTEELRKMVAEKPKKKLAKEPWENSDLVNRPNIPASYVQAKKQANGKYKLFFTGTTSEVFEGELFASAPEARSFFKAQQVKAQKAASKKKVTAEKTFDPLNLLKKTKAEFAVKVSNKEKIIALIDTEIAKFKKEIKDWASRQYKKNKKVVASGGKLDDLNAGLTTVDAANERRRQQNINIREESISELEKVKERLGKEDVKQVLEDLLDSKSIAVAEFAERELEKIAPKTATKKEVKPATKKVVGQRSNKKGVEFYNPFNVKTRNKIIEGKPNSAGVVKQFYRDGFFSQYHYAVKLPEAPKTKRPLLVGKKAPDIKAEIPTEGLINAIIIGEFKSAYDKVTLAHAITSNGLDVFFNANYIDIVLTKYPDAKLSVVPNGWGGYYGIFKINKKVVGIVMSLEFREDNLPNRIEQIQKIKGKKNDVKFSVAEEKDLVAYHNLTGKNLIDADNLGGMPMPSMAITKKDFPYESFGDITMIGTKDMVNPEGTFNRVFDSDIFSPTVPPKERDLKKKAFSELWNRLSSKIADVGDYIYSLEEKAEQGYDQLLHYFDNSNGLKVAFLREQNIPIRIPMRNIDFHMPFSDTKAVQDFVKGYKGKISDINLHSPEHKAASDAIRAGMNEAFKRSNIEKDIRKDIEDTWFDKEGFAIWGLTMSKLEQDAKYIRKPGKEIDKAALRKSLEKKFTKKIAAKYLEWTKKQIGPLYGDPYLKIGRKKEPYTLSNVFEAMHRQNLKSGQDLITFGPGKARAMGAKEFATLDAVRKHKAALVSKEKFEKLKEEQDKKRESLTNDLARYYQYKGWRGKVDIWESINDSMKAIGIFLKSPISRQTPSQMKTCLSRRGFKNVKADIIKDVTEFAKTLRTMPTEYFEVKPERIVSIGEFSGAALPKNVDPKVKEILKKHGVPFKIYKTEAERQTVTASFQRKKGVLFSEELAKEPANNLTVDTAKAEIAKRIGQKAVDALEKSKKVILITREEQADIIGYERASKDQGFFKDGTVYLIPENIGKGRAWNVLMHELGVHLGYNKIFGEKLAREVFRAFVENKGKNTPLGRAVDAALKRVENARVNPKFKNEEAVAYFTEEHANIDLPLHRKIIARMRLWAVKYLGVKPDVFVMDDYVALAASAMRGEIKEAYKAPTRAGESREVFYSQKEQQEISKFSVPKMPIGEAKKEITDNPNFVKWFGDSKVVDWRGKPLPMYHWTPYEFDAFNMEGKEGAHFGTKQAAFDRSGGTANIDYEIEYDDMDKKYWVYADQGPLEGNEPSFNSKKEAKIFISQQPKTIEPITVYLKLENPIEMPDLGIWTPPEMLDNAPKGLLTEKEKNNVMEADDRYTAMRKLFLSKGIDGVYYTNTEEDPGSISYIVFSPTQIKSIFNVGTFEPTNADIRYSTAEKKDLQSWADDLIKSAKDSSFILDTQETSPEKIKESSIKILADLDLKKLSQPAKSFLAGMSPKGKGAGAAIEKWLASPEWYQHPVLKKIVGHALNKSEKFHTTFNEFNAVDDPFVEHDTVAKTLEALARKGGISKAAFILGRTSADFKKLETLLDDADVYGEKHTVEELKKKGYSEDVVQAWSVVRESYDKQLEALIKPMEDLVAKIKEQAAFMGTEPVYPDFGDFIIEGKKRRLTLQDAVMEMGRYKGTYSPRIRDRGAWVVTGKKEGVISEGGDEYVRYNRKTKSFANLLRDKLKKEGFTDIKVRKESRLPEETFQAVRMAEMGTMIEHAATKGLGEYDGKMQMAFMDEIITASADLIKSRGARATMIRRREGAAVKGYITNPLTRFIRYTGTNAAGIAKKEMAERMIRDLYGTYVNGKKVGGIDAAKEGEVHSLARAYIEEQLRNAEAGDRIIGVMKALTTFKFLGFNPRSVLVNISALATSVPVSLHTYIMDGKGSLLKIGKVLSKSCKDYTKVMAGKRLANVDEQTFIDEFRASGYTDAQYTRDAMGNVQGAYGTAWSKLMGGSMYVFGKSEEWVRGGTALAAYRLCRKQGLSHAKANTKAIEATAKAHGTYGKETLPMVAWGKGVGRLGQAFYTYMKFPHNYLQMLYDAGIRKKNIKGVIFGMAAPAVLGGIAAVPMYSTIMAIANALMSAIGDDRDAEKLVYDTINEYTGKAGEETIRGGVLGLLDIDISGSLAMGPGAIPTSLFELTGAVGGMAEDIYRGAGYAIEGEYGRAFEKLTPKAIGNIALAIRETREGATTSRGNRIWDEEGRPYMPTSSETIKRSLGFRSARRALLAQSTWVSKREEQKFKKTQSDIYRKIKYLTAGSENVIINKEIGDEISKYNKNALKTSNVPLITPASIERQMERMKTPTTKQKARVTGCERAAMFEGDIWAGALGITDEMDETQSEVKRLSDAGILKYSAPPSRNINAGYGVKVKLDDDQYSRYVADTSAIIKGAVDRLTHRSEWRRWSDKKKAFAIKVVINKGRKIVRDRLKITILRAKLKRGK